MIALFIVPIVLVAFVSFYLGKSQERAEWNKLIEDGILTKQQEQ
jgi:Tfp pilus assembly protein PilW